MAEYLRDEARNILPWDLFHLVNENYTSSVDYEKCVGNTSDAKIESTHDIILEACDLYVIGSTQGKGDTVKLFTVVDPIYLDLRDTEGLLMLGYLTLPLNEQVFIKFREDYLDGPNELKDRIQKSIDCSVSERKRFWLNDLIDLIDKHLIDRWHEEND